MLLLVWLQCGGRTLYVGCQLALEWWGGGVCLGLSLAAAAHGAPSRRLGPAVHVIFLCALLTVSGALVCVQVCIFLLVFVSRW